MITAITTTANRPLAFALCERWMARQTVRPDEWIVASGGDGPVHCTQGQRQIWVPRPPGALNLANNLLNGLALVTAGDESIVIFIEDDDWYRADHIENLLELFAGRPNAWAAGDTMQRYYNVPERLYRSFDNVGASLCQTGIRGAAVPILKEAIFECAERASYGIDGAFWRRLTQAQRSTRYGIETVVGIKGLPGQVGLGIGHRPSPRSWALDDAARSVLTAWIGPVDTQIYVDLLEAQKSNAL